MTVDVSQLETVAVVPNLAEGAQYISQVETIAVVSGFAAGSQYITHLETVAVLDITLVPASMKRRMTIVVC